MAGGSVSVVIPTRDRPDLLARALRSVLAQREVALEVIVVDDGSPPGGTRPVDELDDRRVRVLRHDRSRGVSQARNTGIEAAQGEWLAFVDDDDLWAPDKLASQLGALAAAPGCRWSCVGVVTVDAALRIIGWRRPPDHGDIAVEMLVDDVVPGGGSGVLAARDLVKEAGGFDTALSCNADWDMYLRLAQLSPVAPVDRPLLAYRVHERAMSLDVPGCDHDFDVMVRKYAHLRAAAGVTVDRATWAGWRATTYLRTGRRWRSVRALSGEGGGRPGGRQWARLARGAVAAALPGSVRLRDYRQGRRVPPEWRAGAEAWLAPLR
jgi:glycosyltransferase involved in cell wall biosynthesis